MKRDDSSILRAQVVAEPTSEAVARLHEALARPGTALVTFFCSPACDRAALARAMGERFRGMQVVGCTTAGEIGPLGYAVETISAAAFPAASFAATSHLIGSLDDFDANRAQAVVQEALGRLERGGLSGGACQKFALLMIDGLSVREERVTRALQLALGSIPLVGGSAGDGLDFRQTAVYYDGRFHSGSAVLTLVTTTLPAMPVMTQHFVATQQRVVVTAADPARRIVHELDGRPAARVYADLLGADVAMLGPEHFAASPMAVLIGGVNYVRSISKALPDGSLKFFCAIEEGMVLRVTHGADLAANLEQALNDVQAAIGEPVVVLGCDCILRRLEAEHAGLAGRVGGIMQRFRVTGFNSYGEQFRGVHVNQTFSGIAIGSAGRHGHGG